MSFGDGATGCEVLRRIREVLSSVLCDLRERKKNRGIVNDEFANVLFGYCRWNIFDFWVD